MTSSPDSDKNGTHTLQSHLEKAGLALGLLRDTEHLEQEEAVNRRNLKHRDDNMSWWRQRLKSRFGINLDDKPTGDDDVGSTVRVDSPDQHYHYPPRGGLLSDLAKLAIAAALGAGGLAAWSWYNSTKPPAQTKPVLDPGGLKIDVERPK